MAEMASSYRTRPEDGVRCKNHRLAVATETCARCRAGICDVCATFAASRVMCHGCCEQRLRRRRGFLLVSPVVVLGFGVALGGTELRTMFRKPPDAPAQSAEPTRREAPTGAETTIAEREMKLAMDPCNEADFLALLAAMHEAWQFEAELARIEEHLTGECANPFEVHLRKLDALRAFPRGGSGMSRPLDEVADWHTWTSYASSAGSHGRLEEERADWEQTVALYPNIGSINEGLADLEEKLGRPCEAILPLLAMVRDKGPSPDALRVKARAMRLLSSDACRPYAVSGHAKVGEVAEVMVNGRGPGRFMRHMEWLQTLVSRPFAERVGLEPSSTRRFVHSPDGIKVASLVRADVVEANGAKAPLVELSVIDDGLPRGIDGRLGLGFFLRFRVTSVENGRTLIVDAPSKE
jgi:hypothetical protein